MDGDEAAARVAYALSEVVAIYPITPASAMGEHADAWSNAERPTTGAVPRVVEIAERGGRRRHPARRGHDRGAHHDVHRLQGLLLMLPNLFKLAGELTPTVIHVAARTVATHALSIFGDHQRRDRGTHHRHGHAVRLVVQEAHDFAAVAHGQPAGRVPFLHFFDGFRTSHGSAPSTCPPPTTSTPCSTTTPSPPSARGLSPEPSGARAARPRTPTCLPGP